MSIDVAEITVRPAQKPLFVERRRHPSRAAGDRFAFLLDQIDYGMIVVTEDHRLGYANHAAREALGGRHPLAIGGDELRAHTSADAASLRKALDAARRGLRSLLVLGTGDCIANVAVVPLHPVQTGAGEHAPSDVLLVIGKNSLWGELSAQWYARLHGLTATETQVLNQLCSGARPAAIARQQGVAVSTIRTQIGSIRAKTGAATIAAVLRKIAVLPPLVCALQLGCASARATAGADA